MRKKRKKTTKNKQTNSKKKQINKILNGEIIVRQVTNQLEKIT